MHVCSSLVDIEKCFILRGKNFFGELSLGYMSEKSEPGEISHLDQIPLSRLL